MVLETFTSLIITKPRESIAGVVGGVVGTAAGVTGGRAWQKVKDWDHVKGVLSQNKALLREIEELKAGNQQESQTRQARAVLRVAILRELAWRDGILHDKEKLYLYEYVLSCSDISAEVKIELMQDINIPVNKIAGFWKVIKKSYKDKVFASQEEKQGFERILYELAGIDGHQDKCELSYIESVLNQCGRPFRVIP